MKIPKLIAICGYPGAGKSTVQKILADKYSVQPVDDGLALRRFCVDSLGMSWDDVQTAEGKSSFVEILGKRWQRRKILGEIGNQLEEMFGDHIMPFMATRSLEPSKSYSFGSVRKNQGEFFRQAGGVVIGVRNWAVGPSPHAFDRFDEDLVDVWIENNYVGFGLTRARSIMLLEMKVEKAIEALAFRNRPIDYIELGEAA